MKIARENFRIFEMINNKIEIKRTVVTGVSIIIAVTVGLIGYTLLFKNDIDITTDSYIQSISGDVSDNDNSYSGSSKNNTYEPNNEQPRYESEKPKFRFTRKPPSNNGGGSSYTRKSFPNKNRICKNNTTPNCGVLAQNQPQALSNNPDTICSPVILTQTQRIKRKFALCHTPPTPSTIIMRTTTTTTKKIKVRITTTKIIKKITTTTKTTKKIITKNDNTTDATNTINDNHTNNNNNNKNKSENNNNKNNKKNNNNENDKKIITKNDNTTTDATNTIDDNHTNNNNSEKRLNLC